MRAFTFRFDKRRARPAHWPLDEGEGHHRDREQSPRLGARDRRGRHFASRHSPPLGGDVAHAALDAAYADRVTPPVRLRTGRSDRRSDVERRRITIFDTTLRDGEQSPGIALQPHEKAEIAEQLERLGADVIEAGFPASSPGDFEGVREVASDGRSRDGRRARTDAARGRRRGRRGGGRGSAVPGARLHRDERPAHGAKARARARGGRRAGALVCRLRGRRADEVQFSAEDATRSDPDFLARVCREAIAAGATTVNLPDTVGYSLPAEHAAFLRDIRARCPELDRVTLSVHCHDDLGLAVANSLAGVEAGAGQVECTVNGIGERAGNAALEEIVMALRVRADASDADTGIDRRRDRPRVGARLAAHRLLRPALQGDRGRERVRARGRHPPGRRAQGRLDVPDHGSGASSA